MKNKNNKTEIWENMPPATRYDLPYNCPKCRYNRLTAIMIDIGTFPYIYADITFICESCKEKYNFCFPQHPIHSLGKHNYDSLGILIYQTEKPECPFHKTKMEITRYLGNLVYSDGTQKIQYKCPTCYYWKRITVKEGNKK